MKTAKKILMVMLCVVSFCVYAGASDSRAPVTLCVDGRPIGDVGIIVNGRTLAPIRDVGEALGATVSWDGSTQEVSVKKMVVSVYYSSNTVRYEDRVVKLKIGDDRIKINGIYVGTLDVPAQIINDKTMIPVRAVSEIFDAVVEWDGYANAVNIKPAWNDSVEGVDAQRKIQEREIIEGFTTQPVPEPEEVLADWVSESDIRQADLIFLSVMGSKGFYSLPQNSVTGMLSSNEPVYSMPDLPDDFELSPRSGEYNGIEIKVVNGIVYFWQDDLVSHGILGDLRFYTVRY